MTWIPFALLSHLLWAMVNVGDKALIGHRVKNPYVYMTALGLLSVSAVGIIPFIDVVVPSFTDGAWMALAAGLFFFAGFPYIHALKIEEVSRVNMWWNLIPVMTLILGWLLLSEKILGLQFVAFLLLFLGSVVASVHLHKKHKTFSRALGFMVVASMGYALYAIIFRHVTSRVPFGSAFLWINLAVAVWCLLLFLLPTFRFAWRTEIQTRHKHLAVSLLGISVIDNLGSLFNIWSLSYGPAALIFALAGSQMLFVFMLSGFLHVRWPQLLVESFDRKNILLKTAAFFLIFAGILLLYLTPS